MNLLSTILAHFDFPGHVQHWMERYGYFALFGVLFSCGLGFPLPEDVPLLIAGAFVATGKMKLAWAALAAWCGIIGGDIVLYHLGKAFGLEVRRLPMIGRHLNEQRIEQVHGMFERWGVWVVAVGRMFAGIRGTMVVVAGAIRFKFWKFLIADGLAAVVSGGLFLALGIWFGRRMDWLKEHVEKGKEWSLLAVLVLGAGVAIWIYFHRRERHAPDAPHGTQGDRSEIRPAPVPESNVAEP
jgi:membrane protein DedA with SNARE-associated domain